MSDYTEHLISMAGGDGEPEPLDLDAIQARYSETTNLGEWEATRSNDVVVYAPRGFGAYRLIAHADSKQDAEFIAHARTDVPALLALVREQQARIERVEALAAAWEARGESDMAFSKDIIDENISIAILTYGAGIVENARHIRAALTATEGAE